MFFEYTRRHGAHSPVTDAATFRVNRLSRIAATGAGSDDLSHLIDGSYDYHSLRELRWHLADRLGMMPAAVALRESA